MERSVLTGNGIDIGCGTDPVIEGVRAFDIDDGDANHVSNYVKDQFDFVYSSHCLEHMYDPQVTLLDWFSLVRPGGHLFFIVPDEDLYEQGIFPSRFNPDHKATFTISKVKSWSKKSYNVFDLATSLPNSQILKMALVDIGYDRSLSRFGEQNLNILQKAIIKTYNVAFTRKLCFVEKWIETIYANDQTRRPNVSAQIECIVRKNL